MKNVLHLFRPVEHMSYLYNEFENQNRIDSGQKYRLYVYLPSRLSLTPDRLLNKLNKPFPEDIKPERKKKE